MLGKIHEKVKALGAELAIKEKAYFLFFGEVFSSDSVSVYGETRAKAQYQAFKDYGDGDSLIEFCGRFPLRRWKWDDLYQIKGDYPPLSELAKSLLVVNKRGTSGVTSSVVSVKEGVSESLDSAIAELSALGYFGEPIFAGPFVRYPLNDKGRLHQVFLQTACYYYLKADDIEKALASIPSSFRKNSVSLVEIKPILAALTDEQREKVNKETCYIYSGEWGLWWRAESGYSEKRGNCERFTFENAFSSSGHCGPEKYIEYCFYGDSDE